MFVLHIYTYIYLLFCEPSTANKNGVFKDEIVPVTVKGKKGPESFEVDEHPRAATLEAMAKLPPVFKKNGTVNAGNASVRVFAHMSKFVLFSNNFVKVIIMNR